MNDKSSGLLGIGGLIAGVVVLLAARRYFPTLANLLLALIGICVVLVLLLVAVVLYFAFWLYEVLNTKTLREFEWIFGNI